MASKAPPLTKYEWGMARMAMQLRAEACEECGEPELAKAWRSIMSKASALRRGAPATLPESREDK